VPWPRREASTVSASAPVSRWVDSTTPAT